VPRKSLHPENSAVLMCDYPKISIVTPCYNHARWIDETMCSIHSQGYPNLEHIVVDGGSTDGSVEIIRRYEERLAWWCSEKDSGHGEALAKGLERITGDIVTWVCSDDLLLPGSLYAVAGYFKNHPEEEWVTGDGLKIDADSIVRRRIYGIRLTHAGLVKWSFKGTVQPAIFIRTRAFNEVGGIGEAMNLSPDYDLVLRLARRRPSGYVRAFLGALRIHEASQTISKNAELRKRDASLKKREQAYLSRFAWFGGRYALARYATKRLIRLAVEPFHPDEFKVNRKFAASPVGAAVQEHWC